MRLDMHRTCLLLHFSRCDSLARGMAWSGAWLPLYWCFLMEYFLKWCVETLQSLLFQAYISKARPYKSANRMPRIRHCVYSLILVLGKMNSSRRNCFAPACCLIWSSQLRTFAKLSASCVREACGEFSQWNLFLPSVGRQLLPSTVVWKYACSRWHCHSWMNPACSHHGPHLLSERKKALPIFTVCVPNLNFNPLFWDFWYAHSHT